MWGGGLIMCLRAPSACNVPRMVWICQHEEMESSCPPCLPTPPHTRSDTSSYVFSTHLRDTRSPAFPRCCGGLRSSWSQDESKMTDMLPLHNQTGFYWRLQLRFPFFTAHNLTVHWCKQVMASTLITGGAEMIILDIIAHNVWKMICFGYGPLTFYLKGWFLS